MKRVYLSHPYGGKAENREAACAVAAMYRYIWEQDGVDAVIVNPLELLAGCDGLLDDQHILNAAIDLMLGCDAVIFCAGWRQSNGCKEEYEIAETARMHIEDLDAEVERAAVHWFGKHRVIVKRMVA